MSFFALTLIAYHLAMICPADDGASSTVIHMQGKVVDANLKPLDGVWIVSSFVHDPNYKSMATKTEMSGAFSIDSEPNDSGCLQVFIYKPGYACEFSEAYDAKRKPFVVQLEPEVPFQVQVVDADGKPVAGARVSPSELHFNSEFTIARIDDAIIERFGLSSLTDANGTALLRGIQPNLLWAVRVNVPGHAPSYFRVRIDLHSDQQPNRVLQLGWRSHSGTLKCMVTEANGEPAHDAYLIVMSKEEDSNVLRDNTPLPFVNSMRKLDDKGCLEIDVASELVEIKSFSFHRGISRSFGMSRILNGKTTEVQFQLPDTCRVVVSVLDLSNVTGPGYSGITIDLRTKVGRHFEFASGVTNDDGIAEIEVTPGEWEFSRVRGELPSGYMFDDIQFKVTAVDTTEPVVAPPIIVRRGHTIFGTIAGVDCASLRYDFLVATYKSGDSEQEAKGKVDSQGNFSVTLPPDIDESQITLFEITHAPVTNRRALAVQSRVPWKLDWKPDEISGIGVSLELDDDGKLFISQISPNGPAARCQRLTVGARLISLADDFHPKTDLTVANIAEANALMQGSIGSPLTLQIVPKGKEVEESISVTLRRGRIVPD